MGDKNPDYITPVSSAHGFQGSIGPSASAPPTTSVVDQRNYAIVEAINQQSQQNNRGSSNDGNKERNIWKWIVIISFVIIVTTTGGLYFASVHKGQANNSKRISENKNRIDEIQNNPSLRGIPIKGDTGGTGPIGPIGPQGVNGTSPEIHFEGRSIVVKNPGKPDEIMTIP